MCGTSTFDHIYSDAQIQVGTALLSEGFGKVFFEFTLIYTCCHKAVIVYKMHSTGAILALTLGIVYVGVC